MWKNESRYTKDLLLFIQKIYISMQDADSMTAHSPNNLFLCKRETKSLLK